MKQSPESVGRNPRSHLPTIVDPNQRYSIPEANALLRQSTSKTFQQIKSGELRVIRDGGRTYVPGAEIRPQLDTPQRTDCLKGGRVAIASAYTWCALEGKRGVVLACGRL